MKKLIIIWLVLAMFIVAGCTSNVTQYTPENLINKALQDTEEQLSFYGEGKWKIYEEDTLVSQTTMKEWHNGNGKMRLESTDEEGQSQIITYDGEQTIIYWEDENEAFIVNDTEFDSMNQSSLKEQSDLLLEMISETHEIEVVGEDKIAGYDTLHLKARPKENKILLGEQDIWIDKKNWMVLKQHTHSGDTIMEMTYQHVDYGENMPADLFAIDLPDSVTIEYNEDLEGEQVTLNEAISKMEESFIYLPEDEKVNLTDITLQTFDDFNELTLTYERDGLPFIQLTVSEASIGLDEDLMTGYDEVVEIRNREALFFEDTIRLLDWDEGSLHYTMMLIDPIITFEEAQQISEEMVEVNP